LHESGIPGFVLPIGTLVFELIINDFPRIRLSSVLAASGMRLFWMRAMAATAP
jgi:hypothetical protein